MSTCRKFFEVQNERYKEKFKISKLNPLGIPRVLKNGTLVSGCFGFQILIGDTSLASLKHKTQNYLQEA